MEFALFIILVPVLILVISIINRQKAHSEKLNRNLNTIYKEILDIKKALQDPSFKSSAEVLQAQQLKEKETAALKEQEDKKLRLAAIEEMQRQKEAKRLKEEAMAATNQVEIKEVIEPPANQLEGGITAIRETKPVKPAKKNTDLEKFIGENLVSKIGIGVLVLAIGFFVKYAIDKQWIGPVARVAIGILCGGILITLAHRLRNSYKGFSSVLAGGGLAVLYFTITLAYHQFQLFGQTTAFVIMIVITAFAVILSLLYNKQEMAIIALLGGFLAPFLVSDNSGHYKTLFIYLIVLNSGLLVIAYKKSWRLLNLLSFIFTAILFGSWLLLLDFNTAAITYKNGLLFASVFYLMFFIINIAHNIHEKKKFIASDFGILLAGTALYFASGIYCLTEMGASNYRGLFSASIGFFNLAASYFFFRKQKVDTNILYLLVGITLTFISITAPIQLHGNYITIFWASETVLLYWLFTKSKIRIIQYASVLVWILMLFSLLMDWVQLYVVELKELGIIANRGFMTTLFSAAATYLLFVLRHQESEADKQATPAVIPGKNVFRICAIILLFAAGALEINQQFTYYFPGTSVSLLYLFLYTVAFIHILVSISQKIKPLQVSWYMYVIVFSACMLLYLVSLSSIFHIQAGMLEQQVNLVHFFAHWAAALLVGLLIYRLTKLLRDHQENLKSSVDLITWILCAIVVIYLSAELHLLSNTIFFSPGNPLDNIQRIYIKTGLPILWGLCSFAFMWLGMHFKYRMLRIISLSLFTLTLLKLFIFDIRNIPAGGKIAAFFCLGILLLVVSFMYQRLKKIIIDNEEKGD